MPALLLISRRTNNPSGKLRWPLFRGAQSSDCVLRRIAQFYSKILADGRNDREKPTAITPVHVLSSPLDGTTIVAPNVLVNRDTAAAPQNETAIAVDPNNPNWLVGYSN